MPARCVIDHPVDGDQHSCLPASHGRRRQGPIRNRMSIGSTSGPPSSGSLCRAASATVRLILDGEPDLRVVAEAGDGAEAVEKVAAGGVDLAILDIAMPRMTGLQAAREMTRRASDVRILMLSMYDNEQYFFEALKAGASGYVLKSVADQDLVAACRAAMRGEPFLYAGAIRALIRDYLMRSRQNDRLPESRPRRRPGRLDLTRYAIRAGLVEP